MIYGAEKDKGLCLEGCTLIKTTADKASVWDPDHSCPAAAFAMTQLDKNPDMPRPMGIFRRTVEPTLDEMIHEQVTSVTDKRGTGDLKDLIYTPDCWEIS